MPTRAAIYARISQDREGEGLGVQRQDQDCKALAKRRGWQVVETYSDDDASAYTGRPRPEYRRMLADVRTGRIQAIVAYRSDRLYRRLKDLADLTELVQARQVKIATVASGDVDLSSADGLMVANILGSVAQAESHRQSERLRRQKLQAAEQGRWNGGQRPFGYDLERDDAGHVTSLHINDREAEAIRGAAQRIIGGDSVYRVVRDWNDSELLSPNGNRWQTSTVAALLRQPSLAGIREHRPTGTRAPATWEAIISEDEHELLKVRLAGDGSGKAPRPSRKRALLSGIVRCSECGRRLLAGGGRYVCDRGRGGGCGKVRVANGRALELAVLRVSEREWERRRGAKRRPKPTVTREERGLVRELRKAEQRMHELAEMLGAGEIDRRAYRVATTRTSQRIEEITRELDVAATPDADAVELTHEALITWLRGDDLQPEEIARLQEPLRATGDWFVHPGERFKRYDADTVEERVELRPR